MAFFLSVEAHGKKHVKNDIQAQISFSKELIFNEFEACRRGSVLDCFGVF
jgi:hypothetical protein